MPVCGPKLSACGAVLGIWGAIQLGIMGVFYYVHALALVDYLPVEVPDTKEKIPEFYDKVDDAFAQSAYNCWIAAGLYVLVLVFSIFQIRANASINN